MTHRPEARDAASDEPVQHGDALGRAMLIAQIDAALAGLEMWAASGGEPAALPFFGLARYEISDLVAARTGIEAVLPASQEAGLSTVEDLLGQALATERELAASLHLLRARGLLRDSRRWAVGRPGSR